jgi:hypothetical protein
MSYDFYIDDWYSIKEKEKEYPWPCESEVDRTITIFSDDVLTHQEGNSYMKHTGLGCLGIIIPKEDLIHHETRVHLVID